MGQQTRIFNMNPNAIERYEQRARAIDSLVCIGLDTDYEKLPIGYRKQALPQYAFNRTIIRETHSVAAAYKLNTAFYEARGEQGWQELKLTTDYLRSNHPEIVLIGDAKRADIGNTNAGYVEALFDWLEFDMVTLHPYLGREALQPFLDRTEKGCIILCRTSNPGAGEIQDLLIDGQPLWKVIAHKVAADWNANHNCLLVIGATYPTELQTIRQIAPQMTFLIPGIGAQGGDIESVLKNGLRADGLGLIISASRSIIFDEHPAQAAEALRADINRWRG